MSDQHVVQVNDTRQFAQSGEPVCGKCRKRPGTIRWGDALAVTHGFGEWRCEICALVEQIAHAKERARKLPAMERKLARLKAREVRKKNRAATH